MDQLSPQERAVYNLVAANPFASQAELAAALGLARPTIAAHIVALVRKGHLLGRGYMLPVAQRIVALGAAAVDRKYHAAAPLVAGTSNPARGSRSFGGVARNVIENLARLGVATSLITMIGDDEGGREILAQLRDLGVDTGLVATSAFDPTAEYVAVLDPYNDLAFGIANMGVFDRLGMAHFERVWPHLASAAIIFADCNLRIEVLAGLVSRARSVKGSLVIDTTSAPKARRLPQDLHGIDILFTNQDEASALLGEALDPDLAALALRKKGVAKVVMTMGSDGCLVVEANGITRVHSPRVTVRDVTGAGDALIAGTLYRLLAGEKLPYAARVGVRLAALTVESDATVLPTLCAALLERAPRTERAKP